MSSTKKPLLILFFVVATELVGFGLIIPILPQLGLKLGVSTWWLGVLMASYSAAQFIANPILGSLSDRVGRRPVLIMSKIGTMVGYFVLAVSHSYPLFLISRLIDGFTGGNISVARAYVADVTTPENRTKGMAVIGMAFGTGFILGPALGGLLYQVGNGHTASALVAAVLSGIAVLLTYFFLEEPEVRKVSESRFSFRSGLAPLQGKLIWLILGVQWMYMMIFSGFEVTFSVFSHYQLSFNEAQNSWLFVYAGLVTLIVQGGLIRRLKMAPRRMLSIGIPLTACGFGLLVASATLGFTLGGLTLIACGMGLTGAALPAWLSTHLDPHNQGIGMGIYEAIGSLSRVLGPLVSFAIFGWSPVGCYSLFSVALIVILIFILGLNPRRPDAEPSL